MTRRHDHDGSWGIQIDLTVRPQRQQTSAALHNQPVSAGAVTAATHQINAFSCDDVLPHNNRAVRLQRNFGIAAKVHGNTSQISIAGITHRINASTGNKHPQQCGFLIRRQRNPTIRRICREFAGGMHQKAFTSAVTTAVNGNAIGGSQTSPCLNQFLSLVERMSAQECPSSGRNRQFSRFGRIRDCFRQSVDGNIRTGIQCSEDFNIARSIDHNAAATAIGGLSGRGDATRSGDHQAEPIRRVRSAERFSGE